MRWWEECGSSHLDRKKQYFGFPSNFTVLCLNVGQMQLPQFYYSLRDKDILINIHRSSGRIFFHSAIRRPLVLYLFLWRHFPVSSSLPFPHGGRRSSPAASASPDLPLPMGGGSSQSAATRERGSVSASQEVEGSIRGRGTSTNPSSPKKSLGRRLQQWGKRALPPNAASSHH